MTPVERITAAIDLNPDRPRVTLRRDDVRKVLADSQASTPTMLCIRLAAALTGLALAGVAGFVAHG